MSDAQSPRADDPDALQEVLERHLPRVRAFVRLRLDPKLRARLSASDIVQSVCGDLLAHDDAAGRLGERQLRRWLYTSVLNKLREKERYHGRQRRAARREVAQVDDPGGLWSCYEQVATPSHAASTREQLARFEAAFDRLPEHYREVITLMRIVRLSQAEAAEVMGRSVASVRNLLSRALVRLAAAMDEDGAPAGPTD